MANKDKAMACTIDDLIRALEAYEAYSDRDMPATWWADIGLPALTKAKEENQDLEPRCTNCGGIHQEADESCPDL